MIKIVKLSIINSCVEVGSDDDDDDDDDEDEEENQEGEEDCEDCDEDDSEVEDEEVTFKWPELVQLLSPFEWRLTDFSMRFKPNEIG